MTSWPIKISKRSRKTYFVIKQLINHWCLAQNEMQSDNN